MAVDKLVDSSQLNSDLTSVANAIRTKGGTSASLAFPDGFVSAVAAIPTGGGSMLTGTFTGTDAQKGSAIEITVPYTGNGYPIAILIYPTAGAYKSTSTLYTTVQRYALLMFGMAKSDMSLTPNYSNSGANDYGTTMAIYKTSDTDAAATTANRANTEGVYRNNAAAASHSYAFRVRSATQMSAYIASTSYGFMAGVEYTYVIVYSS